ncbi:hypothetical protein [Stenoxybacter acetivorans]|uniref:hypothetical protein n=1 Tax=Stenoxybacter acetivorans TaxID=422441 RepID=UPI00056D28B7|nr:hypothetical protein [Stenoxybacter acetivorans]
MNNKIQGTTSFSYSKIERRLKNILLFACYATSFWWCIDNGGGVIFSLLVSIVHAMILIFPAVPYSMVGVRAAAMSGVLLVSLAGIFFLFWNADEETYKWFLIWFYGLSLLPVAIINFCGAFVLKNSVFNQAETPAIQITAITAVLTVLVLLSVLLYLHNLG